MKIDKDMSNDCIECIQKHSEKELEYYKKIQYKTKTIQDSKYYLRYIEYYQNILADIKEIKFINNKNEKRKTK